ncbi:hypothetical protein F0562_013335 [Nyssa sinensis]|uniref:Uncharacterized protein n=1 Tax=Nyssa sinensis TaxID=561372 RepID=A0A5J4ZMB3_9ASTE|nr:hypothetical protein F0562_013335 [Nyssa sinensis]
MAVRWGDAAVVSDDDGGGVVAVRRWLWQRRAVVMESLVGGCGDAVAMGVMGDDGAVQEATGGAVVVMWSAESWCGDDGGGRERWGQRRWWRDRDGAAVQWRRDGDGDDAGVVLLGFGGAMVSWVRAGWGSGDAGRSEMMVLIGRGAVGDFDDGWSCGGVV